LVCGLKGVESKTWLASQFTKPFDIQDIKKWVFKLDGKEGNGKTGEISSDNRSESRDRTRIAVNKNLPLVRH
jgi:hypothetical protein